MSSLLAQLKSKKFQKLLVVNKITRLQRFENQGLIMNPYVEKVYKHQM
jgi:hypothetical protein